MVEFLGEFFRVESGVIGTKNPIRLLDAQTAEMTLKYGAKMIFDASDIATVSNFHWTLGRGRYATTYKEGRDILFHKLIVKEPKNQFVKHISGNTLDNRRTNLRIKERLVLFKQKGGSIIGVFGTTGQVAWSVYWNENSKGRQKRFIFKQTEEDKTRALEEAKQFLAQKILQWGKAEAIDSRFMALLSDEK